MQPKEFNLWLGLFHSAFTQIVEHELKAETTVPIEPDSFKVGPAPLNAIQISQVAGILADHAILEIRKRADAVEQPPAYVPGSPTRRHSAEGN